MSAASAVEGSYRVHGNRFFDSAADGGFAQNDTVSVILVTAPTVILSEVSAANAAEGSSRVRRKRFFDSAADGGFAQNDRCLGFSFYPKDSSPPPRNDTVSVILVTAPTVILSGVSAANAAEGSYRVHRKRFFDSLRSLRMTLFLSS